MNLDKQLARRIIAHLKAGTTPLEGVAYLNVGNERWFAAAAEQFDEVAADGDALVRFISGYYGDGKTHFLGMLRSIAFDRGWFVSYVTAETTPLHKFDVVYAEVAKNITLPSTARLLPWIGVGAGRGASVLLGAVFAAFYQEAYRSDARDGLHKERVLAALRQKAKALGSSPCIHQAVGAAVIAYTESVIRGDTEATQQICAWLEGSDVRMPENGLSRRIDQKVARDVMRSLSALAQRAGLLGGLILLDEAERILTQSRQVRQKSYGVLRDLLDNTDGQGGMQSAVTYVAATPEMFESERGFAEYDALRSRLRPVAQLGKSHFVDWRAVVVDLSSSPFGDGQLAQLFLRIVDIHAIARSWSPGDYFSAGAVNGIVEKIVSAPAHASRPRMLAACAASLLETLEQNRSATIEELLGATLEEMGRRKLASSPSSVWE
jgi:hypothetical protein